MARGLLCPSLTTPTALKVGCSSPLPRIRRSRKCRDLELTLPGSLPQARRTGRSIFRGLVSRMLKPPPGQRSCLAGRGNLSIDNVINLGRQRYRMRRCELEELP
jgi:hypothetical protein